MIRIIYHCNTDKRTKMEKKRAQDCIVIIIYRNI